MSRPCTASANQGFAYRTKRVSRRLAARSWTQMPTWQSPYPRRRHKYSRRYLLLR